MGYTHYWKHKRISEKDWNEIVIPTVTKIHFDYKDILDDGTEEQFEISSDRIVLNGIAENSHETFMLTPEMKDFDFCKTAKKPYDIVVCLILIALSQKLKSFSFSSDGISGDTYDEEWELAMRNYNLYFPEKQIEKLR